MPDKRGVNGTAVDNAFPSKPFAGKTMGVDEIRANAVVSHAEPPWVLGYIPFPSGRRRFPAPRVMTMDCAVRVAAYVEQDVRAFVAMDEAVLKATFDSFADAEGLVDTRKVRGADCLSRPRGHGNRV